MANYRLAHVSDLHFGRKLDWSNPADQDDRVKAAKTALGYIVNGKRGGPITDVGYPSTFSPEAAINLLFCLDDPALELDAIVVTGDLATTGSDDDLSIAKSYFSGMVPESWGFEGAALPSLMTTTNGHLLITLPGNHDRYNGPANIPGSQEFENYFGRSWDFDENCAYPSDPSDSWTGKVQICGLNQEDSSLVILLADLSLPNWRVANGFGNHLGQGCAVEKIVYELRGTTANLKDQANTDNINLGIVWAVHFPPSFPNVANELALLESARLLDAAAASGVKLILAGHTHKTLQYVATASDGTDIVVICSGPSAGISNHKEYGFSIIDVDVINGIAVPSAQHYKWQDLTFKKQNAFPLGNV